MSDDQAYRRGTLLGLTVAEIFILLIFLLLLAFLGLSDQRPEELKEREREVQQLTEEKTERQRIESVLREWRPVIEEFETPAQVRTLAQQVEIERQAAQETRKEAESAHKENKRLSQRITDLQTEPDDLVHQVETARQAAQEATKEAESAHEENKRLSRQITDLQNRAR